LVPRKNRGNRGTKPVFCPTSLFSQNRYFEVKKKGREEDYRKDGKYREGLACPGLRLEKKVWGGSYCAPVM